MANFDDDRLRNQIRPYPVPCRVGPLLLVIFPVCLALIAVDRIAQSVYGQLPHARLDWVYPLGARPGTTLDVAVGGADIDFATGLVASHPGIVGHPKVSPATEFNPQPDPIANSFQIEVAADVPPGVYDLRVVGRFGVSSPRRFVVDTMPELLETPGIEKPDAAMPVAVNSVINGRANASAKDHFRLELEAGQRVFLDVVAQRVDSQMDATIAIFDPHGGLQRRVRDKMQRDPFVDFTAPVAGSYLIELYDFMFQGGENYFYRFSVTDRPSIDHVFPPAILAGTSGRISLFGRNLPGSTPTELRASDGVLLERLDIDLDAPAADDQLGNATHMAFHEPVELEVRQFPYQLNSDRGPSNRIEIGIAADPVTTEVEPNDASRPQQIVIPCEFVGQFYPKRDEDWIEFAAKKDEQFWMEIYSDRLGLATDPYLLIKRVQTEADGKIRLVDIADADDSQRRPGGAAFGKPTQDPTLKFQAPESGSYRVFVRDANSTSRADLRNVYRLSIRRPKPSFHLMLTTLSPFSPDPEQPVRWTTVLRRGASTALTVAALRHDEFDGPITLTIEGLPTGVVCEPAVIGSGQNEGILVIQSGESAAEWTGPVTIVGHAKAGELDLVSEAQPAVLLWDAPAKNARTLTRIAQDVQLMVAAEIAPAMLEIQGTTGNRVETSRGGNLSLPFKITKRGEFKEKFALAPMLLPAGVKGEIKLADDAVEGTMELTVEPTAPLLEHTLAIGGKSKVSYQRHPQALQRVETQKNELAVTVDKLAKEHEAAVQSLAAAATETGDAKALLEQQAKEAEARSNAAKDAFKQLEERIKQLTELNKPADVAIDIVSTPVTLKITDAPLDLHLAEMARVMAPGASGSLDVTVVRRYGFTDVVPIEVVVPESARGLKIEPATLAVEQSTSSLAVTVASDTPPGSHTVLLRAKVKFNGHDLQTERKVTIDIAVTP